MLHGAYITVPSMGAIIPKLAKTHKVYALEFQGHGRTTDIDRPITYPNLADDVAVFMDAVGIEKADVFGYSMGQLPGKRTAHPAQQTIVRLGYSEELPNGHDRQGIGGQGGSNIFDDGEPLHSVVASARSKRQCTRGFEALSWNVRT